MDPREIQEPEPYFDFNSSGFAIASPSWPVYSSGASQDGVFPSHKVYKGQDVQVSYFSLRWSLWKNHQNVTVEEFKSFQPALHKVLEQRFDRFIYQLECPQGTENYHYQIFAYSHKKDRPSTLARVLHKDLFGINVQHCHSPEALETYCMKPETRVQGPWHDKDRYTGKDLLSIQNLYPWQKAVYDRIETEPDERKIYWIYDPVGCTGKSKFCKMMAFLKKAKTFPWGRTQDLLHQLVSCKPSKAYLFDLTRTKQNEVSTNDLYSTMESIKNGFVLSTKFVTKELYFDPPHVFVFANILPDRTKMTQDRWVIRTIKNNRLEPYVPDSTDSKPCGILLQQNSNRLEPNLPDSTDTPWVRDLLKTYEKKEKSFDSHLDKKNRKTKQ